MPYTNFCFLFYKTMIREGKPLPNDVLDKMPAIVDAVKADPHVIALLSFGSLASGNLSPLSDLDFGVLLDFGLNREQRFQKHLDLIGTFNATFRTDEIDLVLLNDASPRFGYHITANGKVLFCRDRSALAGYIEKTTKLYLDFKPYRERFDQTFLQGIDCHG
jgi:predicted nucleotidyltransferase